MEEDIHKLGCVLHSICVEACWAWWGQPRWVVLAGRRAAPALAACAAASCGGHLCSFSSCSASCCALLSLVVRCARGVGGWVSFFLPGAATSRRSLSGPRSAPLPSSSRGKGTAGDRLAGWLPACLRASRQLPRALTRTQARSFPLPLSSGTPQGVGGAPAGGGGALRGGAPPPGSCAPPPPSRGPRRPQTS